MSRVPEEELQHWIARYNEIRETQRSGYERTAAMTEVVQAMRKLASILPSFDWKQSLQSKDRGVRLAAYAYLFERPNCDAASPLVGTLTGGLEDKPFGQYWALKALRPVLDKCDSAKRQDVEPALRAFASRLGPGTDRQRELTRLLESMYDDSHNATRAR